MGHVSLVREFWDFLKVRKKFWLLPIVMVLLLLGLLVVLTAKSALASIYLQNRDSDNDLGPFTLLQSGTYTLVIDASTDTLSNYSFRLLDLSAQASVAPDQPLTSGSLNPGRSAAVYQLAGQPGQWLYFESTTPPGSGSSWYLYAPNDQPVFNGQNSLQADLEVLLPTAGTYALVVDGANASVINYSFRIYAYPTPTNSLSLNAATTGNLTAPGERHVYTFTGTTGQRLYYDAIDADNDPIYVTLYDPVGTGVYLQKESEAYRTVSNNIWNNKMLTIPNSINFEELYRWWRDIVKK